MPIRKKPTNSPRAGGAELRQADQCGEERRVARDHRLLALLRRRGCAISAPTAGEYLPGHTSMIRRDPIGVVDRSRGWNYPLDDGLEAGAGNRRRQQPSSFKPSEQTPLTALKLARLVRRHSPRGVVNVINRPRRNVGNALITIRRSAWYRSRRHRTARRCSRPPPRR